MQEEKEGGQERVQKGKRRRKGEEGKKKKWESQPNVLEVYL